MLKALLFDRRILWLVFAINLFGTIYGFIWYDHQLAITPWYFLIFVPDSPMASMFFTIFLFFYLVGKHLPYIQALAFITLLKYGVWAVVMNLLTLKVDGSLSWQGYMLIASHGAMAVQAILYRSLYTIQFRHIVVAAIWTLHNDVIDYVYGMMPIYSSLTLYMNDIGYFTFWLSVASIITCYLFVKNSEYSKLS